MEKVVEDNSPSLSAKVPHCCVTYAFVSLSDIEQSSLTPSIIQQTLDRDHRCIFSEDGTSCDSGPLVATWIFPPFMGHKASNISNRHVYMFIFCDSYYLQ